MSRPIEPLMSVARALLARADCPFPSLAFQRTSDVTGATVNKRGAPADALDRPSPPFLRRPAKGAVIQKSGMPFTVPYVRVWLRKDRSLRPHASASRSRCPHFFPKLGRVFDWALQASRSGHPRTVMFFLRETSTFETRWMKSHA